MTRPFRPSNGTQGDIFVKAFCSQCTHMKRGEEYPCPILGRAFCNNIGDPDYPAEWVQDDDGSNARCTAFQMPGNPDDPPVTPRCTLTKDLFE